MKAITVDHVTLSRGGKTLYQDFSISFERGKITTIIAPSGSGKTTLLNYLAGLSRETPRPMLEVSVLFQEPRLLNSLTVLEYIALPLKNRMDRESAYKTAESYLQNTKMLEKKDAYPRHLSGGEKQRVALARAFAFPAPVLLLDEPFHSLDIQIKIALIQILESLLKTDERTVIFVTHDIEEALAISDRILVLNGTPLSVRLDVQREPTEQKQSFKDVYVHPNEENQRLKQEIISLL